jgi:hypothetical protein
MNKSLIDDQFIKKVWENRIRKNGLNLKDCKNQTYELCEMAIVQNPNSIKYIDINNFYPHTINELFEFALKMDGLVIKYIDYPSDRMKKIAITQNGLAIEFIHKPSYDLCKLAIAQNKESLSKIDNIFKYILNDSIYNEYKECVENCNICYSSEQYFLQYDCKHMNCRNCTVNLKKCPMCRSNIHNVTFLKVKFE